MVEEVHDLLVLSGRHGYLTAALVADGRERDYRILHDGRVLGHSQILALQFGGFDGLRVRICSGAETIFEHLKLILFGRNRAAMESLKFDRE